MVQSFRLDVNGASAVGATSVVISRFAIVSLNSSGDLVLADSSSGNNCPAYGIALNGNGKLTLGVSIAKEVVVGDTTWAFTPGQLIYVGTAGAPTAVKPTSTGTMAQVIGIAETATRVRYHIEDSYTAN